MIPDFGDANWLSNWDRFLVFFETAAQQYKDRNMKWAAATIARRFIDFENPRNVGLGYFLLDCYRWGTDQLSAAAPAGLSAEVMEDVQGTTLNYTIVNLTRALFRDRVLVDVKPSYFGLAFDGSPETTGTGKLRYWRDQVDMKKNKK